MSKLPNFLTLLRIFLLPLLIYLIIDSNSSFNLAILILFIVIALSDYFDGVIARKTNSTSEFGKMLDPIADKLFVVLLIITFILYLPVSILPDKKSVGLTEVLPIKFDTIGISSLPRPQFPSKLSIKKGSCK